MGPDRRLTHNRYSKNCAVAFLIAGYRSGVWRSLCEPFTRKLSEGAFAGSKAGKCPFPYRPSIFHHLNRERALSNMCAQAAIPFANGQRRKDLNVSFPCSRNSGRKG